MPELSPDDQRLLDALMAVDMDVTSLDLTDDERRRADTLLGLFELLEDYPVDDAEESLVDATLAGIDRYERKRTERMLLPEAEGGRRRIRVPDFLTVAAVLLIGVSVVVPVLHQFRQRSIDLGCENNMRLVGYAMSHYALDHNNHLPVAQAGLLSTWTRSTHNVVNLSPLAGTYCEHQHLNCPGCESAGGDSYAYQWVGAGALPRWETSPQSLVLADRNPVIDAVRKGRKVVPTAASLNHGGRGQNLLRNDGNTMWLRGPAVVGRGDNIWLPAGFATLFDGVQPMRADDVFLAN
jgi:hypothetical protein